MRRSKPVTIQVKELPQLGKPAGFGGTVGNVTMATSLSADTVNANDAITYKVTFRGTGNLKLLKAPTINFLDFEVYDPKESRDLNITENGMAGSVSFEYLIIPVIPETIRFRPFGFLISIHNRTLTRPLRG